MNGKIIFAVGLYLAAGNGCAFLSVAADKYKGLNPQEAAVHSLMNYTPLVNSIGYRLGHERFYGNPNFEEVLTNRDNESRQGNGLEGTVN